VFEVLRTAEKNILATRLVILVMIACLFITACSPVRPPTRTFYEVTGSQAERVDTITALITKLQSPPTPLLNAYFVEEKIGDGEFGPSDYRSFYRLDIAPDQVQSWQSILSPLNATPDYATPSQPYAWWLPEADFATLQFYAPELLTGRSNGWLGIDLESGQIYIFTFTT
jgi:hypothetical protein